MELVFQPGQPLHKQAGAWLIPSCTLLWTGVSSYCQEGPGRKSAGTAARTWSPMLIQLELITKVIMLEKGPAAALLGGGVSSLQVY